jgi:hypothetical protein
MLPEDLLPHDVALVLLMAPSSRNMFVRSFLSIRLLDQKHLGGQTHEYGDTVTVRLAFRLK